MNVFKEFEHGDFPTFWDDDLAAIRERDGWPVLTKHHYGLCITPGRAWNEECSRLVHEYKPVGVNLSFPGAPSDLPTAMREIGRPRAVRLGLSYDADVGDFSEYADSLEVIEVLYPMKGSVDVSSFRSLRKLILHCMVGAFANIEETPSLEELFLYGGPRHSSFDRFQKLRSLKSLTQIKGGVEELGFTFPRPEMRELKVSHCYKFASLDGLEMVPNLRSLEIVSAKKLPSIDAVAELKNLEMLVLDGCGTYESLDPILELKDLQHLSLDGSTTFKRADFMRLLDMPNLRHFICHRKQHYNKEDFEAVRWALLDRRRTNPDSGTSGNTRKETTGR